MFAEKNGAEKVLWFECETQPSYKLNLNHAFRFLKSTLLDLHEGKISPIRYSKAESELGVQKKYIKSASVAF
jgi:hypothetical protein